MVKLKDTYLEILLKYLFEWSRVWFLKEESPVNSSFMCCGWVSENGDEIVLHVLNCTMY